MVILLFLELLISDISYWFLIMVDEVKTHFFSPTFLLHSSNIIIAYILVNDNVYILVIVQILFTKKTSSECNYISYTHFIISRVNNCFSLHIFIYSYLFHQIYHILFCCVFLQHAQVSQVIQKFYFLEIPFLEPAVLFQSGLFLPLLLGAFRFPLYILKFQDVLWIVVHLSCWKLGKVLQFVCPST